MPLPMPKPNNMQCNPLSLAFKFRFSPLCCLALLCWRITNSTLVPPAKANVLKEEVGKRKLPQKSTNQRIKGRTRQLSISPIQDGRTTNKHSEPAETSSLKDFLLYPDTPNRETNVATLHSSPVHYTQSPVQLYTGQE